MGTRLIHQSSRRQGRCTKHSQSSLVLLGWGHVMAAGDTCSDPTETTLLKQTLLLKLLPLIQTVEQTVRSCDLHFFKCTKFLENLLPCPSSTSSHILLLEPPAGLFTVGAPVGSVIVRNPAVGVVAPPSVCFQLVRVFLMPSLLFSVVRLQRSETAFILDFSGILRDCS